MFNLRRPNNRFILIHQQQIKNNFLCLLGLLSQRPWRIFPFFVLIPHSSKLNFNTMILYSFKSIGTLTCSVYFITFCTTFCCLFSIFTLHPEFNEYKRHMKGFYFDCSQLMSTGVTLPRETWSHVTIQLDSASQTVVVYVDGTRVFSSSVSGSIPLSSSLTTRSSRMFIMLNEESLSGKTKRVTFSMSFSIKYTVFLP